MNTIMIVYGQYFQFINIMIEDKGTCSHRISLMSDYLPLYTDFMKFFNIFYKILYEITIQIVRQSTILFMNTLKLSQ